MNYKMVLCADQFYQEIELNATKKNFKIGTGKGCDIRFSENMVPVDFEITVSCEQQWRFSCSENIGLKLCGTELLSKYEPNVGDKIIVCTKETEKRIFLIDYNYDFGVKNKNYDLRIDYRSRREFAIGTNQCSVCIHDSSLENDEIRVECGIDELVLDTRLCEYGITVNGIPMKENTIVVKDKDFFALRGYQFFVYNGELYTTSDGCITTEMANTAIHYQNNHFTYPKFVKNVRQKYVMPENEISILDPKALPQAPEKNIFISLIPSIISIVLIIAIRGSMGGNSSFIILSASMMGMGIVTSIITYINSGKKYRKEVKEREQRYMEYLEDKEKEIIEQRDTEHEILCMTMPTIEEEIKRVSDFDSRLFEKAKTDEDFLSVQIGKGIVQTNCHASYKEHEFFEADDVLMDYPERLSKKYEYIQGMPVVMDLKKHNAVGFIGNRSKLYQIAKNLILSICIEHFYQDIKLFFVLDQKDVGLFEWSRWLQNTYMGDCVLRNYMYDEASAKVLLEFLYAELSKREVMKEDAIASCPHMMLFVYRSNMISNHPIIQYVEKAKKLGFTFLFFEEYKELVNEKCEKRIFLDDEKNAGYIQDADDGKKIQEFTYEHIPKDIANQAALKLGCVYVDEVSLESNLTKNISLFRLLGIMSVNDLEIGSRWNNSKVYESMAAPLGVKSGNEIVYLDLHEKQHGPHGLVAGTTGSGKSEILQSYILSMATLFHPYEVGFIIIDFKGGGMANQFRKLPHLKGAITNIDGNEINRSLKSIRAELHKRQELFAQYQVNHIDDYIRKFKQGETKKPLPHLILIVDEFAELKSEQPEFMKELISAARIGRSLGVHLILATQKPSGVVNDQIWSNSRFKLCLKVQTQSDSNEVLKVPLAAEIREPGRAYLQVGNNEIFQLFQSAYSGAMVPNGSMGEQRQFKISKVNLCGQREVIYEKKFEEDKDGCSQLDALVEYIDKYCVSKNIEKLSDICLPSLPHNITYESGAFTRYSSDVCVPLGNYDAPDKQYQGSFDVDLSQNNIYVIGSAQMGKTNLLQCVIRGLAENYSSDETRIFILDFASEILRNFKDLKHVSDVIVSTEKDKMKNFFDLMEKELIQRKEKLSVLGLSSLSAYRESGQTDISQIVVMVDNIVTFRELYPDYDDNMQKIVREGNPLGVCVIITTQHSAGLGFRYLSNFSKRFALFCNDSGEYSSTLEQCRMKLEQIPGRCILENAKEIYEGQLFETFPAEKEIERVTEIRKFVQMINETDKGKGADGLPSMPNIVTKELLDSMKKEDNAQPYRVPIGMSHERLEVDMFGLSSINTLAVCGNETKNVYLRYIIEDLLEKKEKYPVDIYVMDDVNESLADLKDRCAYYSTETKKLIEVLQIVGDKLDYSDGFVLFLVNSQEIFRELDNNEEKYKFLCEKTFKTGTDSFLLVLADIPNEKEHKGIMKKELYTQNVAFFMNIEDVKFMNINDKIAIRYKHTTLENGDMYFKCGTFFEKYRTPLK